MFWKVTTFLSLSVAAVFAGLFFSEKPNFQEEAELIVKEKVVAGKTVDKQAVKEVAKNSISPKTDRGNAVEVNPKVIVKEVNPFPEVSKFQVEKMQFFYDRMIKSYSSNSKRQHGFLYRRLSLDEEQEKLFSKLVGERVMYLTNRIDDKDSDQVLNKDEILEDLDNQMSSVLGDKFDDYVKYREKVTEYTLVSSIERNFSEDVEKLTVNQQDQLADILGKNSELMKEVDWRSMRRSPEKLEKFMDQYASTQELMFSDANGVLNGDQLTEFKKAMDSRYKRYEQWLQSMKSRARSGAEQR